MSARLEGVVAASVAHASAATHAATRVSSIDILRGLVMVLMALDHVRDFFTDVRFDPLDLSQTNAPLFLTRWITHFCAPTFVLLAGVSAYLTGRHCTRAQLSWFLFTRGLWLVVLEVTLMSLVWTFNVRYDHGLFLQVIWAIGVSMMVLAALVHLPLRTIAVFSIVIICGHNLLDGIEPQSLGAWAPLWSLLHVSGPIPHAFVAYPLIPWIAVMSLGYCLGALFDTDPQQRKQWLIYLGAASLTAFVLLRMTNLYGDPDGLVIAEHDAADAAVFRERAQISAVAALPAAHAGNRTVVVGGVRIGARQAQRSVANVRARAAVLLRDAHRARASGRGHHRLRDGLRHCAAQRRHHEGAAAVGVRIARRLSRVGARRSRRCIRRVAGSLR